MNAFNFFTKTIARKIASGFAAVLLILLAIVAITIGGIGKQQAVSGRLVELRMPETNAANSVLAGLYMSSSAHRGYLLTGDETFLTQRNDAWEKRIRPGLAKLHEFAPHFTNIENRKRVEEVEALAPQVEKVQNEILAVHRKNPKLALELVKSKVVPLNAALAAPLDALAANAREMTETDGQESLQVSNELRLLLLSMAAAGLALGGVIAWVTARAIVVPVGELAATAQAMAGGDLSMNIEQRSEDEIGQLAGSFAKMIAILRETLSQTATNAHSLSTSSEELAAVSQQMSANAEETSAQSQVVAAASEQVSKNIQTVATASEEMTASIREIAKNASDAARVAAQAVRAAENTNTTVGKLGESSAEIGQVIKVITSIAQQTNLLALNATIEAARAGEAGKGFAVVANEVKELAKETAKATEEISRKIEAIQTDTKSAVTAIGEIGTIIAQISDIQNTIASAVEEQSATTNEIGRNVTEAAKGSSEIAENIGGVARAAKSTSEGASNSQTAATELSRMSAQLQSLVARFTLDSEGPIAHTSTTASAKANLRVMGRKAA